MKSFNVEKAVVYIRGAMVVVAVGEVKLRRFDFSGGKWPIAMRNALHKALQCIYPRLKKVKIPRGNNDQVWDAVVRGYELQVFKLLKRREAKGRRRGRRQ